MSFELGFPCPDHNRYGEVRIALAVTATGELLQVAPSPSGNEDALRALMGMVSWEMLLLHCQVEPQRPVPGRYGPVFNPSSVLVVGTDLDFQAFVSFPSHFLAAFLQQISSWFTSSLYLVPSSIFKVWPSLLFTNVSPQTSFGGGHQ